MSELIILMSQSNNTDPPQNLQQLQAALKETLKQNKSLQNKNSKLQTKYIEIFNDQKSYKKDHATFVNFFQSTFRAEGESLGFQEVELGKYELADLQRLMQSREQFLKSTISKLQQAKEEDVKAVKQELKASFIKQKKKVEQLWEGKMKALRHDCNKQVNAIVKELDSLKRNSKSSIEEAESLKTALQSKTQELSKLSKEKLKLEHHLNNVRKKQISQELSTKKDEEEQKNRAERNEFLSLRQQVETLLSKRDELRREISQKEEELVEEKKISRRLQEQVSLLNEKQSELDEKYELVRECPIEELQNLFLSHHTPAEEKKMPQEPPRKVSVDEEEKEEQVKREYLRNVLLRYIKAQTSGSFEQALTLLEILGTLLRLDGESVRALENYIAKRKQWWLFKY